MNTLLIWALIASGLVVVGFFIVKSQIEKISKIKKEFERIRQANERLQEAVKKREHIINRMEEVNANAAEQKREIRNHDNSADRAHAATDAMRKLSRRGSGDDPAAED